MLAEVTGANYRWLCTGREVFPAMLEAIDAAEQSVRLETYIFSPEALGQQFLAALVRAQERGCRVQVLVDGLGSYNVPWSFWRPLQDAGGEVRYFNPLALHRFVIRNHRKLLVCDDQVAFVGGFNIAPEYDGDGITCGWCDVGLRLDGPLAGQLAASFEEMFARADFQHRRFVRLRKTDAKRAVVAEDEQLLLSGPGRGPNPIKKYLRVDLARARSVQMMVAYFLPTWRLRRQLAHAARDGAQVELLLAGKTDVTLSQLAARSLYRRLLKGGIQIHEYQPQVLHAKLFIVDDVVYVGSSNLDLRSLEINYELMLRFRSPDMAAQARQIFHNNLQHCQPIRLREWRKSRSFWQRLKQRWAYFLLVRVDPYLAQWQWQALPD